MTEGSYLASTLELALFVGVLGFCAYRIRPFLVPGWRGALARLVEAIIALTLAVWIGEVLGIFGLLKEGPLLILSVVLALLVWRIAATRPAYEDEIAPISPISGPVLAAGFIVTALVITKWTLGTLPILDQGMWGFDTMQYHMPFAAGFAQSGSVTDLHFIDPTFLSWFDPANSELLHGEALAIAGTDFLSPLLNLGWAALALLAGWCIGRPYGRAPLTLLATAALLVTPIFLLRQPGQAMSDIAAAALLLSAVAILVAALDESATSWLGFRTDGALLAGALAAGLAMGAKASLVPAVIALGIGVIIIAERPSWVRVACIWAIGTLSAGGLWYLRNLVVAGNPLPWVEVGVGPISLPETHQLVAAFPGSENHSVAHYLTDDAVWREYFGPGLNIAFGELWPVLLGLFAIGCVGGLLLRNSPIQRVVAVTALIGLATYVFAPGTAPGLPGHPTLFPANLRYVLPVLAIGLALLPTLAFTRHQAATAFLGLLLAAVTVVNLLEGSPLSDPYLGGALIVTAGALLCIALASATAAGNLRSTDAALYGIGLVGVATVLYWPQVEQYMEKRYTNVWPNMSMTPSFRWAKDVSDARIALAGTTGGAFQYAYYGDDSSNEVVYLGERGARGAFDPIQTCEQWRSAVNDGGFNYVITTPSLDYYTLTTGFSPERSWTAPGPATTEVFRDGPTAIYRVDGQLDLADCRLKSASFTGLAPLFTGS